MAVGTEGRTRPLFMEAGKCGCRMKLTRIPGTNRFRIQKSGTVVGVLAEDKLPDYIGNREQHGGLTR